jgi:hypothetical protein
MTGVPTHLLVGELPDGQSQGLQSCPVNCSRVTRLLIEERRKQRGFLKTFKQRDLFPDKSVTCAIWRDTGLVVYSFSLSAS